LVAIQAGLGVPEVLVATREGPALPAVPQDLAATQPPRDKVDLSLAIRARRDRADLAVIQGRLHRPVTRAQYPSALPRQACRAHRDSCPVAPSRLRCSTQAARSSTPWSRSPAGCTTGAGARAAGC